MDDKKTTPGPWKVLDGPHCKQIHAANHWIANIKCESCPAHEDGNAELIASAPDLLAENKRLAAVNADLVSALEQIKDAATAKINLADHEDDAFVASYWGSRAYDARKLAEAALARARGES